MSTHAAPSLPHLRPGWIAILAILLVFSAEFAQALLSNPRPELTTWYIGLHTVYLVLYVAILWKPVLPAMWLHFYFGVQSLIVAALLWLNPELGTVTALFILLCYQTATSFPDNSPWMWMVTFAALILGLFMFYLGTLTGLARALLPMAGGFILTAYIRVNRELEAARAEGQLMLAELNTIHQQLQAYATKVEELTAIEERNRLARELHDSVSQTLFSIVLNTRSAQLLLERDPPKLRPQLEQLQQLNQAALAQMRSLIAQWWPASQ